LSQISRPPTATPSSARGPGALLQTSARSFLEGFAASRALPYRRFRTAEFALALEQIQELRKIYEQLRITDDTFVYLRGVPMLPHTMKLALSVFRGLGAEFPAQQWISEFAARVDDEGAQYLRDCSAQLEGAA
jgi:hypothetical protein